MTSNEEIFKEINRVATRVDEKWKALGYRHEQFSGIAYSALESSLLSKMLSDFSPMEYLTLFSSQLKNIKQQYLPGEFCDHPITVFRAPNFHIEVNVWGKKASTSIHNHHFSGALEALTGNSIHDIYSFEQQKKISTHVSFGNLKLVKSDRIKSRYLSKIECNENFIHRTYHLNNISAVLVIRADHPDIDHVSTFLTSGHRISYYFESDRHQFFEMGSNYTTDHYQEVEKYFSTLCDDKIYEFFSYTFIFSYYIKRDFTLHLYKHIESRNLEDWPKLKDALYREARLKLKYELVKTL